MTGQGLRTPRSQTRGLWRKRLARWLGGHRRRMSSALAFVVSGAVFSGLIAWLMGNERATAALQSGIASIASGVLNLLGNRTTVAGVTIQSPRFCLSVVAACTGLFLTAVFVAAVIAYPSRLVEKLVGAALGAAAIFILNLARLVSLFYVGVYLPGLVEPVHLLVWQSLLIVSVLVLWLLWAGKVTHASDKR
jgi:exosortase/archaeosortase family protein